MERNDERNDRMLDSNELDRGPRGTAGAASTGDPAARVVDDRVAEQRLADQRLADERRLDDNPADEIGEAVGGISGVLTGAALGSLGGPIGTIIGGIAGAVTGWWAGKAISEAASHVTHDDESYYRSHYESSPDRLADRSYEDVRPAYQLGHLAGRNPEYQGRSFEEVESDLQRGWTSDVSARHGDWQQVRPYARDAYERGRAGFGMGAVAGSGASAGTLSGASGTAERATITAAEQRDPGSMSAAGSQSGSLGASGPAVRREGLNDSFGATSSTPAPDVTDRMGYGSAGAASTSAASSALHRAEGGVARGAHEIADRVDDLKDRVDGNPASRPGPDATDRPGYGAGSAGLGGGTLGSTGVGGAGSLDRGENALERGAHRAADTLDDLKDRVDGNPASRPGPDATDRPGYGAGATGLGTAGTTAAWGSSADRPGIGDDVQRAGNRVENATENAWDATKRGAERVGDKAENLWDRTKEGARNLADKVEDKADDVKDRVDGNPASRPGPDPTDRRF